MKKSLQILLILLFYFICFFSKTTFSQEKIYYKLDNGLQVVLIPDSTSSIASIRTTIRTGSIYEKKYLGSGISHYLEHIVSSGTTSMRSETEYKKLLSNLGGASNAYTSTDHTAYFINTTNKNIKKAINILYEWMFFCEFNKNEINRERKVILQEIARAKANINWCFFQKCQENFYKFHPMQYPVLGYEKNFMKLRKDDLRRYYKNKYSPANMILIVGGNFNIDEIKTYIKKTFGQRPRLAGMSLEHFSNLEPLCARTLETEGETNVTLLNVRFPTISLCDKDLYALDLLAFVLAEGEQSILHKKLVEEKKLAYGVACSSYTPLTAKGFFEINIETDYKNKDKLIEELLKIIGSIKRGRIKNHSIRKARKQKISYNLYSIKNIETKVDRAALSMNYSETPDFFEKYSKNFKKTKRKDMVLAAKNYFKKDSMVITILKPKTEIKTDPSEIKTKMTLNIKPEIIRFSNGIRVIFYNDDSIPKVYSQIFVSSGIRAENIKNNGIGHLLAQLLGKGSKDLKKSEIQNKIENNGAKFSASLGNNTLYYNLECLTEDAHKLLPVFFQSFLKFKVNENEFHEEKRQVIKKIKKRSDNWQEYAMYQFKKSFFRDHPYGFSKIGEKESVESLNLEDVLNYHKRILNPKELVITVTGKFDKKRILNIIKSAFLNKKNYPKSTMDLKKIAHTPKHNKAQKFSLLLPQDVGAVIIAYDGISLSKPDDEVKIDILDSVLSGMKYPAGRIHTRLRNAGLVYLVHAYNVLLFNQGYFIIYALTNKENALAVKTILLAEINDLKENYITRSELINAKERVEFEYLDTISSLEGKSLVYATNELYHNDYKSLEYKIKNIRAASRKDIYHIANKYLKNPQVYLFNKQ